MNKTIGTLYGIGVGPGDPDLIPIKSVKILSTVDVIFTASSPKNKYSMAVMTAKPHLPDKIPIIMLSFPMTLDIEVKKKAWQNNARIIIDELQQGKDAVFLTIGDPMTYSTYGYILKNVQELRPDILIKTIPGITSYNAAAAATNTILMEGEESLLILSGVKGGDHLRRHLAKTENVVFLKAYKNTKDIVSAVEEAGLIENSLGIANCGLPEEEIIHDIRELTTRKPGYWTIVIAKQN
ncbi:precorrin-2/cobalt-factor-2 C20-methyltransferase [Candidatus Magnetomoraceae bacterium gMMP-1]